jgi:hypothetical protein
MTTYPVDIEKLRAAIPKMSRGALLAIAERAIDLVPRTRLYALAGDMLTHDVAEAERDTTLLLKEVRSFDKECRYGDFYEMVAPMDDDAEKLKVARLVITEFQRLLRWCRIAAKAGPSAPVLKAFDLLFNLLRIVDETIVQWPLDMRGLDAVGVDWGAVLPVYYRCLADTAPPGEFARSVDRVIRDFAEDDRPRHLASARRVASAEQKAALRAEGGS